jgi:glycosyltransferase involved in cell wall biosynthesis
VFIIKIAVIYALPEKYATSLRLSNIFKGFSGVKKISQSFWPSFFILKFFIIIKQILKSIILIKNDEVVYASAPLISSALPGIIVKKLKGNVLVVDWDDAFMDFKKQKPSFFSINYWEYKSIEMADKVVVVSKKLKKIASSIKGKKNVLYLPNGVDTTLFKSRKKYSGNVIGIVGYIGKIGNKFAYNEMASASKYINAKFMVVGFGKGLPDFKKYLKENGLEDKFEFIGYVDHKKLPFYIDKMDICLVPFGDFFTSETRSSIKIKEFMSMEKPIVASSVGENIIDLDNGRCGLLAKDQDDFIEKIKTLQKDKKLRRILGKRARKRVEKIYDFKILGKKLYDFLKKSFHV